MSATVDLVTCIGCGVVAERNESLDCEGYPCMAAGGMVCIQEARLRAIRAVVAAQWAVACMLFDRGDEHHEMLSVSGVLILDCSSEAIGDLPCAVDVVDGT